jgi:hypothetical protein
LINNTINKNMLRRDVSMGTMNPAKHEAEHNKLNYFLKKLWKNSAPVVIFSGTVLVSMIAVAVWVLNVGNPLVSKPDNIWGVRIALVGVALTLVLAERFLGKNNKNDEDN